MANTLKKIQTITVGSGGASSIEFTSIPQTYTDLKIVLSIRTDRNALVDALEFKFNDSTANRTYRELYGTGASAVSGNSTGALAGFINSATSTASVFSNVELYIPNYTSSNNKSSSVDSVSENNATTAYPHMIANLWSDTSAITKITLFSSYSATILQYSTATLYGISNANTTVGGSGKATGGNQVYTDGSYWYHVFTSDGNFVPSTSMNVDYLVVAGGGGGGGNTSNYSGGGGGAGGLRCTVTATGGGGSLESVLAVTAQTYAITVGGGGTGGTFSNQPTNGSNSVFSSITSTGGGKGAGNQAAGNGGSGGGASEGYGNGTGTANQGYAGGASGVATNPYIGAGGGGANAAGTSANTSGTYFAGEGGNGVTTSISGTSTTYAGGGGGANTASILQAGGAGGTGGGGTGARGAGTTRQATAGTTNSGGGGGAGINNTYPAQNGGSGIVIVRYAA